MLQPLGGILGVEYTPGTRDTVHLKSNNAPKMGGWGVLEVVAEGEGGGRWVVDVVEKKRPPNWGGSKCCHHGGL